MQAGGVCVLAQGVRVQAQQKFHHPAIPRAGGSGGRVIGRQLNNVTVAKCQIQAT